MQPLPSPKKAATTIPVLSRLASAGKVALLGAGLGGAALLVYGVPGGTLVSPATAADAAVTPKTEVPNEAKALSRAFSSVAKALGPSVVRIEVEVGARRRPSARRGRRPPPRRPTRFRPCSATSSSSAPAKACPRPGPQHGVGSGFIIDSTGDIITNRHVVQGATKVTVTMNDGKEYPAKVVGKDAQTDVAVVRLEKPPGNLVVARLGDSDKLEVGEWVVAVGSPLGLEQTVTAGIVSGKGRPGKHVQMSGNRVRGYIQTDAKINPGNSGGPLVNLEGEVVGVNTLIQVGAGGAYGFAIPVNEVRRVAQTLIKDGRMRYAYLGLMLTSTKDLDEAQRAKLGQDRAVAGRPRRRGDAGRPRRQVGHPSRRRHPAGRRPEDRRRLGRRRLRLVARHRRDGDAALRARRQAGTDAGRRWASCPTRT